MQVVNLALKDAEVIMSHVVELTKEVWEGFNEGIKKLVTATDEGKYTLDITALENVENVKALKSALDKERENVKEREKAIKAWEALGKKPEEISELLKKAAETKPPAEPDEKKDVNSALMEQMKKLQEELSGIRKETAEFKELTKKQTREALILKHFEGYSDAQKADFLILWD